MTSAARPRVLLLEDDKVLRTAIAAFLRDHGFSPVEAGTVGEALALARGELPDAAVLDHVLPDGECLEVLDAIRQRDARIPTIVITGRGTIPLAVTAMQRGACTFLQKPADPHELVELLRSKLDAGRRRRSGSISPLLGPSRVARELIADARRFAQSDSPVLLVGELGSGKGAIARWVHDHSPRSSGPFVELGSHSATAEALSSALQKATGGTVYLRELTELSAPQQATVVLLCGDGYPTLPDVRLITSTRRDLGGAMRRGELREEFRSLSTGLTLAVPPLRSRLEDLATIAEAIVSDLRGRHAVLPPTVLVALARYAWPGNLRELRSVLERATLLAGDGELQVDHVRVGESAGETPPGGTTLRDLEERAIREALQAEGGNVPDAARRLGLPRSTLYQRLRELGIGPQRRRREP